MGLTRIFLVRHGPTHQTAFTGWRDVPVDLSDRAAVRRLDDHLPDDALVISSDLQRAVHTADAIAGSRQRLPHDSGLREFNFGTWDGLHRDAIIASDGDLFRQFWDNPGDIAPPGGESWNAVAARVSGTIDRIDRDHPGRRLVVVAHFGAILAQLTTVGLPPQDALRHKIDTLSITELARNGPEWQILRINHNVE